MTGVYFKFNCITAYFLLKRVLNCYLDFKWLPTHELLHAYILKQKEIGYEDYLIKNLLPVRFHEDYIEDAIYICYLQILFLSGAQLGILKDQKTQILSASFIFCLHQLPQMSSLEMQILSISALDKDFLLAFQFAFISFFSALHQKMQILSANFNVCLHQFLQFSSLEDADFICQLYILPSLVQLLT